jgi:hypothetical protein
VKRVQVHFFRKNVKGAVRLLDVKICQINPLKGARSSLSGSRSSPLLISWAEAMIQQRGPIGTRVLHGLLALAGKHPVAALEAAAEKALHHGTWRLRDLRLLLERAGPLTQLDFLETHPLIRSLDAYEALTPDCFNPQPKTVYEHS